jgi:proteic killer suppression protein
VGYLVKRIRNVLAFSSPLRTSRAWAHRPVGAYLLAGDRAGTWSISVSGNWRITFTIERGEITNLDLEDYH